MTFATHCEHVQTAGSDSGTSICLATGGGIDGKLSALRVRDEGGTGFDAAQPVNRLWDLLSWRREPDRSMFLVAIIETGPMNEALQLLLDGVGVSSDSM
jgi:hypothetical protein